MAKPATLDGYSDQYTLDCERVLVTLLRGLGPWKDSVYLVGGLTPRYLVAARPPIVPAHGQLATPSCAGVHGASRHGSAARPSGAVQRRRGTTDSSASTTRRAVPAPLRGPRCTAAPLARRTTASRANASVGSSRT